MLKGCGVVLKGCGVVLKGCGLVLKGCGLVLKGCGLVIKRCGHRAAVTHFSSRSMILNVVTIFRGSSAMSLNVSLILSHNCWPKKSFTEEDGKGGGRRGKEGEGRGEEKRCNMEVSGEEESSPVKNNCYINYQLITAYINYQLLPIVQSVAQSSGVRTGVEG